MIILYYLSSFSIVLYRHLLFFRLPIYPCIRLLFIEFHAWEFDIMDSCTQKELHRAYSWRAISFLSFQPPSCHFEMCYPHFGQPNSFLLTWIHFFLRCSILWKVLHLIMSKRSALPFDFSFYWYLFLFGFNKL